MTSFDITGLVDALGETVTVKSAARTYNDYGDATEVLTDYTIRGIVEVQTGEEDEVKEGYLRINDIIFWASTTETNLAYLITGNYLYYNSTTYRIKNVIPLSGHYEVHAEKV